MQNGGLRTRGIIKTSTPEYPLITVVTVVFNGEATLEQTIQSVVNQTYDNVEYIIVDGGSKDRTLDIIKKYEDRIDYWQSEPDKGIYDAMNKGIELANGDWINFMNSGDSFYNECVIKNIYYGNIHDCDIIYGKAITSKRQDIIVYRPTRFNLIIGRMLCHQSLFVNKSVFINYKFNCRYKLLADKDWLMKLIKRNCIFEYIDMHVCIYDLEGVSYKYRKIYYHESCVLVLSNFGFFAFLLYNIVHFLVYIKNNIFNKRRYKVL